MKITSSILSIPPYLSTTWKNISSLHAKEERRGLFTLVVILQNRTQLEAPGLEKAAIDAIFEAHARFAEGDSPRKRLPMQGGGPIDIMDSAMQHNPEQAGLPPLPPEALKKITSVAHTLGFNDLSALPNPEPHCNCVYCQVARAFQEKGVAAEEFEEVSKEDLTFRDWEIEQTGDKLYLVTNPLDPNEHYNVFLGTPLGCTCGSKNCEHIRSVLNN